MGAEAVGSLLRNMDLYKTMLQLREDLAKTNSQQKIKENQQASAYRRISAYERETSLRGWLSMLFR